MIKPEVESGKELKLHQMEKNSWEKPRGLLFQVRIHLHLKSYVYIYIFYTPTHLVYCAEEIQDIAVEKGTTWNTYSQEENIYMHTK